MNWYRVELDEHAAVLSCALVENPTRPVGRIFYMWASSEAAATAKAVARYESYLNKQRSGQAARRKRNKDAGNCQCGRPPKPGGKQCQVCLDASEDSRLRAQAKTSGTFAPPKVPRPELLQQRKQEHDDTTRLEVLEEVHRVWCHCSNDRQFTAWLMAQIKSLKGKAAA